MWILDDLLLYIRKNAHAWISEIDPFVDAERRRPSTSLNSRLGAWTPRIHTEAPLRNVRLSPFAERLYQYRETAELENYKYFFLIFSVTVTKVK